MIVRSWFERQRDEYDCGVDDETPSYGKCHKAKNDPDSSFHFICTRLSDSLKASVAHQQASSQNAKHDEKRRENLQHNRSFLFALGRGFTQRENLPYGREK